MEKTSNASCAGAQHTNRSVGCHPLRQHVLHFHVAKHQLSPLIPALRKRCSFSLASVSDGTGLHVTDSFDRSETPQGSSRLSPVAEWPASDTGSPTSASLNRSRTLPSHRGGAEDDRQRSRLLRKQKPQTPLPEGLYPGANVSA